MSSSEGARAWDVDRTVIRFPDPAVEVVDERFEALRVHQGVAERLWTGGRWLEGPVWFGDGRYLLFSDIPNDRILRWSEETGEVTTFRQPAGYANGHTRDGVGRLVSCEHGERRVTRTEHDGAVRVLADRYAGHRLNAPNDVVVAPDGGIWFTDPGYGILGHYEGHKAPLELPRHVYRIAPDGPVADPEVVIEGMDRPNGLCFSPDGSLLYVVDLTHVRVFTVRDGRPVDGRVFVETGPGKADGIRGDRDGNVWAAMGDGGAGFDGVHCFAPDGTLLGRVHLPETASNLCFGGAKKNRLFITASRSLYSLFVEAQGAQHP